MDNNAHCDQTVSLPCQNTPHILNGPIFYHKAPETQHGLLSKKDYKKRKPSILLDFQLWFRITMKRNLWVCL